jgi:hypothetical protein
MSVKQFQLKLLDWMTVRGNGLVVGLYTLI